MEIKTMANETLTDVFSDIADAIRAKGVTGTMTPLQMPTKVAAIPQSAIAGDPRYVVDANGALSRKDVDITWFGDVKTINERGLQDAYRSSNVVTAEFPELEHISYYGMTYTFYGASSLKSVSFPKLKSIYGDGFGNCFANCNSLSAVYMPNLSHSPGGSFNWAFSGCTNLALIDFHKSKGVPQIDSSTFNNTNDTFTVLVPATLYTQWKSATNWSTIASQIKAWGFVFVAKEANSTVKIQAVGSAPSLDLEYSTDGSTWNAYTLGDTITLASIGSQVAFRAGTNGNAKFGQDAANYNKFVLTGSVDCFGEMDFLLSEDHEATDALPNFCYYGLFKDCTALKSAPMLPSMNLGEHCYQSMFEGCTGLETAPELPATTLAAACYGEMFRNASTLNYVKIGYTGNFSTTYFNDWLYGVASEGDVAYNGTDTTRGPSAIPVGWNKFYGLRFTALEANSTVSMARQDSITPTVSLEYSTDDGLTWSPFTVGTTTVTLANVDDEVWFRGDNAKMAGSYSSSYNYFTGTGQLKVSGILESILDSAGYKDKTAAQAPQ